MLGEDAELEPRPAAVLRQSFTAAAARHDDPASSVGVARALRRHELLRVATADVLGRLDVSEVGEALTVVSDVKDDGIPKRRPPSAAE